MALSDSLGPVFSRIAGRYGCRYACHIEDMENGDCFGYEDERQLPSASLIKLPVMGEMLREAREGGIRLDQRMTLTEKDKVPYSILTLLDTSNSYTLADLITLMIIQSDNTAANLLIRLAGMDRINAFSRSLGLEKTLLQRSMMDFEARKAGRENFTSAADMGRFMAALYRRQIVDRDASEWMLRVLKEQLDRSMMMLYLPDSLEVAHKTGELENLDHDAGLVSSPAADYSFAALVWNAPDNCSARLAVAEMSRAVYKYYNN